MSGGFLEGLAVGSFVLNTVLLVLVCFVCVPLYRAARRQRELCAEDLRILTVERDGWREVANRALLVAENGRNVSRRATRLVVRTTTP